MEQPQTQPQTQAEAPAKPPWRRRVAWWLGGGLGALLLLVVIGFGVVFWAVRSASGTGWLLSLAPQISVVRPSGSLLGDFAAERLDVALPGLGVLRLDAPRWQGLGASLGDHGRWLHLRIGALHANRVIWLPDRSKPATPDAPATPPASLRLPVEIEIREASVDELRIGGPEAFAVRAIRAGVHLGAEGGAKHRFSGAAARIEQGRAEGTLAIAADAPFAVDAHIDATSAEGPIPFGATVLASGPLAALNVTAAARVTATATHGVQSLDARAVVRPFAAWPLGELQARVDALDLSAFSSAAPATALTGRAIATTSAANLPAAVTLDLKNARAGRWNEGLLPVYHLRAELRARPDEPSTVDVQALEADLGSTRLNGGRITGSGRWTPARWNLDATLAKLRPAALDARAPETALDGSVALASNDGRAIALVAALAGQLADKRLPREAPKAATLRLEATASADEIALRTAEARLGGARAGLKGTLKRNDAAAPWRARGTLELAGFDPAPWWPGAPGSFFSRGTNRIEAAGDFDLVVPDTMPTASVYAAVAALRGQATLKLAPSTLAGVAVQGQAGFANDDGNARLSLDLVAGGNRVQAQGRIGAGPNGRDAWQFSVDAAQLAGLAAWLPPAAAGTAPRSTTPRLAGSFSAGGNATGRWPDVSTDGEMQVTALRFESIAVQKASGRWKLGSAAEAALDASLVLDNADLGGKPIERVQATVAGTARAHRLELRIASAALPPEWADALAQHGVATVAAPASTAAATATSTATSPATSAARAGARSLATLVAEGGLVDSAGERATGWRGSIRELSARATTGPPRSWLAARDLRGSVSWAGGPLRAALEPGTAEALGATLRWSRVAWQSGEDGTAARLDAQATVDAFPVAPLMRALQPGFGWGGDLAIGARLAVRSAPTVAVDFVVERAGGDLTVTDELQTQALGITDIRLSAAAANGTWSFTGAVAGASLGVVSGAVTARTSATAPWPDAATPIEGGLGARVDKLGIWGNWVPPGWRLAGELRASANVSGRFGAPQYTGRVDGTGLSVRNFVEGVNVTEGSVAIVLQGTTARIEKFTAQGGTGTIRLEGDAAFEEAPVARLRLVAEKFQLLGRVDRRIVASGSAALQLDAKNLGLSGDFKVDEGLVDFTRSDAPALGSDVEVVRRPTQTTATVASSAGTTVAAPADAASAAAAAPSTVPAKNRTVGIDLRVGMGEQLRIRGRGLDAGLRGELRITSPGGRLAVNGTLSTVDGTYQAYGQKLGIDRGVLGFVGPVENPRLDIEATRPNLDVRVGVVVSGTALYPRVRLFSEPALSDLDTLSWLVLGRASDTTGGADTALLQQAALALLSGEGPGVTDRLIQSIGLDEIGVRQQSQGAVKDTIVSLGKQISKRWYVGYERGLNSTTGTWQLIYRVAQRITVRAEAGSDNAIDVNWTLRWK